MDSAHEISNKNLYIILLVLILGALVAAGVWYFSSNQSDNSKTKNGPEVATSSSVNNNFQTENSTLTDEALIEKSLVAKTGISAETIEVKVNQKIDNFAKGTVGVKGEETGGGYFLTAKVGESWVIVYDGQATPTCAELAEYKFPTDMVPECLNSSGNVVKR